MAVRYDRPRRVYVLRTAFGIRPAVLVGRAHERIAAEQVGTGNRILFINEHRALGTVNLHARQLGIPDVKTAGQRHLCPAHKLENRVDMSIHVHRQHLSLARAGRHSSRLPCLGGHCADALYRAEQAEQRGDVVRPHIVQWTRTRLIEECRSRMMELVTMTDKPRAAARDAAQAAAVDQLADVLQAAAEKGVRRTANQQSLLLGERNKLPALLKRHRQRLLRVDMLACLQGCQIILIMCLRRCQIENNVNIRVSDQLHTGGVCLGNTVLRCLALCLLQSA